MNELQQLLQNSPDLVSPTTSNASPQLRHLMFSSTADCLITVPLCGSRGGVIKKKSVGVTCTECREVAVHLQGCETHAEALEYIESLIPEDIFTPDPEVIELRHGEEPTKSAQRHIEADNYLKSRNLTDVSQIPEATIGTKEVFYWNMIELDLLSESGETLEPKWEY